MSVNGSRYLMNGAPTKCAFCAQPFPIHDKHMYCWRGSDDRYYCNEYCASSAEEFAETQPARRVS